MAKIKIVPTSDHEVLRRYLSGETGVVLVPQSAIAALSPEQQQFIRANDGQVVPYNFGGDCDVMVDIITGHDSYFFDCLHELKGGESS